MRELHVGGCRVDNLGFKYRRDARPLRGARSAAELTTLCLGLGEVSSACEEAVRPAARLLMSTPMRVPLRGVRSAAELTTLGLGLGEVPVPLRGG